MKIALFNPKYAHNVGAAIRACSCWGADELIWSGKRVLHPDEWPEDVRIPREERMKGYRDVKLTRSERFKNLIDDLTPVAIEICEGSENIFDFEHPENALYIFGPEDGSIPGTIKQHCHRFVQIPTKHCLNLGCAINVVLYDRAVKRYQLYGENMGLVEHRGFLC